VRQAFTEGFPARVRHFSLLHLERLVAKRCARPAERAAGKYLLDVFISGPDTPIFTFLPAAGSIKSSRCWSIRTCSDKRKWERRAPLVRGPHNTILRVQQFVAPELAINTKYVPRRDVSTWKSLLDPKWRGKIAAKDPTITGAGASLNAFFYIEMGADFVKRLYVDQKPTITRDQRQSRAVAGGGNVSDPRGCGLLGVIQFQKLGYPVEAVFPTDAPSVLSGGFGKHLSGQQKRRTRTPPSCSSIGSPDRPANLRTLRRRRPSV